MRKSKWLIALCAATLLLLTGCDAEPAMTYPEPTEQFFVNDYADVMTDADEQAVYEAGVALYQATDAQIVLLTVTDLGGQSLEEYSFNIAEGWGIGDEEKDNGVLLLFTVDGPHSRIEIGYGLEGAINDSKAGRILDTYLVPWYEDSDAWSAQLADTYKAILNEVYIEYGLTENLLTVETPVGEGGGEWIYAVFMLILLITLLSSKRGGLFFLPYFGGFHHHHHGGGGGFSGGGFSGGGFRGGGGGFGGGGASR